jgi:hypothetical protein
LTNFSDIRSKVLATWSELIGVITFLEHGGGVEAKVF